MKLQNKVALITGGSKGIGAEIARTFAKEGAKICINYASADVDAEKVLHSIVQDGGQAISFKADVSKSEDIAAMFECCITTFGHLDILVNNAGVYHFEPFENFSEGSFHYHYNTNVLGTFLCIQAAVKAFGDKGGNIINLSSMASSSPDNNSVVYAGTKAAVDNLTKGLAKSFGKKNIRINAIAPGLIETEGTHRVGFIGGEVEKYIQNKSALSRLGQPSEIASVALFLASEDSSYITGEKIVVSGGNG